MEAKLTPQNDWEWNPGWNEGWTDVTLKTEQIEEEVNYWLEPILEEGEYLVQIWIPDLELEEFFSFSGKHEHIEESEDWKELPEFSFSKFEFLELIKYYFIKGNVGNTYWAEDTTTDFKWRGKIIFVI
ncbi:hypothetical protein O181_039413 [Austropuccinia psidii MF-1]|uniref:Uncharacterized protein n=1 Tax=Austropuccinia psidii MF-1 TaxID=1389203 RepID=A0A9Q3DDC8_9BASI|nr:hypothetical protein [Austropuccinia psidii MF-1]